jgi:glycosyltransferase involved in cell wall biosynthesis
VALKVLVIPADTAGCGYYRLIWAAQHLAGQGHDIEIQWPEKGAGLEVHMEGNTPVDCKVPDGADVVVLQRPSHEWHPAVIAMMRAKGTAVVVDMDDNLTCIHRQNLAYLNYHPRSNTPYSWKNTEDACRAASMVTVSTRALMRVYAKHGRGMVIDNFVPEYFLGIEGQKTGHFGWPGTTHSHPADLQTCGKAVQELIDSGYKFRVIGPPSKVKEKLKLNEEPQYTEVISTPVWPYAVASLDVVLAPLEISTFNDAKSRLKIIEASAVGVPWVASPRTEYRRFSAESQAGILAERPKDWYKGVKQLMDDEVLRKELGERGREYMRTQTVEANSWRLLEAWTKAYEIEQGSRSSEGVLGLTNAG